MNRVLNLLMNLLTLAFLPTPIFTAPLKARQPWQPYDVPGIRFAHFYDPPVIPPHPRPHSGIFRAHVTCVIRAAPALSQYLAMGPRMSHLLASSLARELFEFILLRDNARRQQGTPQEEHVRRVWGSPLSAGFEPGGAGVVGVMVNVEVKSEGVGYVERDVRAFFVASGLSFLEARGWDEYSSTMPPVEGRRPDGEEPGPSEWELGQGGGGGGDPGTSSRFIARQAEENRICAAKLGVRNMLVGQKVTIDKFEVVSCPINLIRKDKLKE